MVTTEYFSIYQYQGITPVPVYETADEQFTYWTFADPGGEVLSIEVDQLVEPGAQVGASGMVAVVVNDEPVAPIEFTTTLFP